MKNKILAFAIGMILLMTIMPSVLSEVYLWDTVIRDNSSSTINFHAFYQFQDTSVSGIGSGQDTRIIFDYEVQELPVNLTNISLGQIDWCNFTITHFKNIYEPANFVSFQGFSGGHLINTTIETQNYFFANSSANDSQITILMRDKDTITADMKCHYTNPDGIFAGNTLAGDFDTYMSSYQCSKCSDFTLEQLSNEAQRNENITQNNLGIYTSIQNVVGFNFQIWLILSWIVKIGLIFVAVGLVFAGVYYFYVFFSNIGKELDK